MNQRQYKRVPLKLGRGLKRPHLVVIAVYLSGIFSLGTHNTDNFVDWISGFINGDFFDLYHVIPFEGVMPSDSLMVPYPPFSLYILGGVARFITLFVPETPTSILVASNLTSVIFTFLTVALLEFRRRTRDFKAPIVYLLTPAVFLMSPVLGYQDTIMTFFILSALILAERNLYFSSGVLASMAVFSKQLAVMPIFGLGLVVLLTLNLKTILKFIGGFFSTFLIVLSPFIITSTLPAYFQAQGLASVHTMMSAQNPNIPWLIGLLARVFKHGLFNEQTYSSLPLRIDDDLTRQALYLGFGAITVLTIFIWLFYWKWFKKVSRVNPLFIGAVSVSAYNLISFGVHENHVFMILPILFALTATYELSRAYYFMSIALALNLIATGGLGRSIAQVPLITQESGVLYAATSLVCLVLYLVAFKDLLKASPIGVPAR